MLIFALIKQSSIAHFTIFTKDSLFWLGIIELRQHCFLSSGANIIVLRVIMQRFSFKKIHLKMLSANCGPLWDRPNMGEVRSGQHLPYQWRLLIVITSLKDLVWESFVNVFQYRIHQSMFYLDYHSWSIHCKCDLIFSWNYYTFCF